MTDACQRKVNRGPKGVEFLGTRTISWKFCYALKYPKFSRLLPDHRELLYTGTLRSLKLIAVQYSRAVQLTGHFFEEIGIFIPALVVRAENIILVLRGSKEKGK